MDAWLFNLVMSYVLRYMLSLEKVRRGTRQRLVVALVAYADDVAIMGRRLADLRSAARTAAKWTLKTFGLTFKPGGDEVAFLSIEEEHRRRHLTRPAARGCPGLDIVGFVIRRTYTTVRRAIFRRARRQYLRAGARSGQKRHGAAFSRVQAGELLRIFYADEFPEMQYNAADRENKTACLPSNRVGNTTEREDTQ